MATTASLTASVTGLKPGTTARFAITAVNAVGESPRSEWSAPVTVPDGATAKPGRGTLWHDNLFSTGDYTVRMTLLKGQNATAFRLYENGSLIATVPLEYRGTAPQSAKVAVSGKKNGTYVYTGELINSKGVTATSNTTVKSHQGPARHSRALA